MLLCYYLHIKMTYFILKDNNGIRVSGQIDVFDKKLLEDNNPQYTALEITEQEYNNIKTAQEHFNVVSGKIQEKTVKEKADIQKTKDDWVNNNTLKGLQQQLSDIKKNNPNLK